MDSTASNNTQNKSGFYKLGTHLAIRVKALEYKNDIPGFIKYVRENKEYFPDISEDELNKLKDI